MLISWRLILKLSWSQTHPNPETADFLSWADIWAESWLRLMKNPKTCLPQHNDSSWTMIKKTNPHQEPTASLKAGLKPLLPKQWNTTAVLIWNFRHKKYDFFTNMHFYKMSVLGASFGQSGLITPTFHSELNEDYEKICFFHFEPKGVWGGINRFDSPCFWPLFAKKINLLGDLVRAIRGLQLLFQGRSWA